MSEKRIQYEDGGEAQPMDSQRKGSIYQVVPAGERRMSAQGRRISVVDDIFGEIKEGGPNYRNVNILPQWNCTRTDLLRRLDGWALLC